ncbi:membrane integrity-associated transporter subunit PqiC [bacterium]|nr:membrane integrity-associated transporter subunit PqiC [bacterium]
MKNRHFLTICALFVLTGCAATAPKTTYYALELDKIEETAEAEQLPVAVLIENCGVREAYKTKALIASPAPYELTKRANAEWAESAGTLLNSTIQSYLSPRCEKVLPPEWKTKVAYDCSLLVYLEAMTQVKRGKNWFAVLRLSYEVLPKKGGEAILSGRLDKALPLPGGDLDTYAAAQSALVKEWLDALLARLKNVEK